MNRIVFILYFMFSLMFTISSCSNEEEDNYTPWRCLSNGIPKYDTYMAMERDGFTFANQSREERRHDEMFYSMQSYIEDLLESAEDVYQLPFEYPNIFEFAADSVVRPILPAVYACIMDTSGLFYVGAYLHKMRGHVYAVGRGATNESLTQVLDGITPREGSNYLIVDIFPQQYGNKSCTKQNYLYAECIDKEDRLTLSARIYTLSAKIGIVTQRQNVIEVSTSCLRKRRFGNKWRAHHTKTEFAELKYKAVGFKYVAGTNPSDCEFTYVECSDSLGEYVYPEENAYHTKTIPIWEVVFTSL